MTIELGVIAPHVPHICFEDQAPDFQKPLIEGLKQAEKKIQHVKPDVAVLISCHWQSTFKHFVDATPQHKGILTAVECPNLITDVAYQYPGDEQLANQLVEAGQKAGIPAEAVNDPMYIWDYGTVVPLRYLVPNEDIPVVNLSVCLASPLEETHLWGQQIGKVLRESEKRAVVISSGALSHNLVRGTENMPTISEQALDRQFIQYLQNNEFASAWKMLSQYAKVSGVESGGRHLAFFLGVLEGSYKVEYLGYGQSSGSGNVVMTFEPL
jgi:3,4-dihydroxyphenylacetate 2,3-dioxygenase